jgi:hypothetical protein
MVHPIPAVGYGPAGIDYASLYALHCHRLTQPPTANPCSNPYRLSVSLGRRCASRLANPNVDASSVDRFDRCCEQNKSTCAQSQFHLLVWGTPHREWHPWPEVAPLIDREVIRWPCDNWPPAQPRVVVEDRIPDAPAQTVLWRDIGGLLDMWV